MSSLLNSLPQPCTVLQSLLDSLALAIQEGRRATLYISPYMSRLLFVRLLCVLRFVRTGVSILFRAEYSHSSVHLLVAPTAKYHLIGPIQQFQEFQYYLVYSVRRTVLSRQLGLGKDRVTGAAIGVACGPGIAIQTGTPNVEFL